MDGACGQFLARYGLLEITFPEDGDLRLTFRHHAVDGRPTGVRLELRPGELQP